MGRGSYLGGSTLLVTGKKSRKKKSRRLAELEPAEKETRYRKSRIGYLREIAIAVRNGKWPRKLPTGAPSKLRSEVGKCATPLEWAKTQPEFGRLVELGAKVEKRRRADAAD